MFKVGPIIVAVEDPASSIRGTASGLLETGVHIRELSGMLSEPSVTPESELGVETDAVSTEVRIVVEMGGLVGLAVVDGLVGEGVVVVGVGVGSGTGVVGTFHQDDIFILY